RAPGPGGRLGRGARRVPLRHGATADRRRHRVAGAPRGGARVTATSAAPSGTARTPAQAVADPAVPLLAQGLPPAPRDDMAARTVDLLGNSLAARAEEPGRIVSAVVDEWGGAGAATSFATGERLPPPSAALVNGTLAHSLDFDDTHLPSVLHPSAAVL